MRKIIPTIFALNKKEFDERFKKIISISKEIQIDFMDGKFVKTKSVRLRDIPNIKNYKNNFEAHLMIENPKKQIKKLKGKGFKRIIFHYETCKNKKEIEKTITKIKKAKLKCFIALNPKTKIEKIFPFAKSIDGVLFMGVYPGKEKQHFILEVYKKIKNFKKSYPKITIQVDGGINLQTAKKLKSLGTDIINTGSFISSSKDPQAALKKLKEVFT